MFFIIIFIIVFAIIVMSSRVTGAGITATAAGPGRLEVGVAAAAVGRAAAVVAVAVADFPAAAAVLAAAAREGAGDMKAFFNQLEHDEIIAAIRHAEMKTSGEIRVSISHKDVADPVAAARAEFEKLGMTRTHHRNGVLIFVAPRARKFAVIGDTAVHERCGDAFWQAAGLKPKMTGHFKKSNFSACKHHPRHSKRPADTAGRPFPAPMLSDGNELPDEIFEGD